MVKVVVTGGIGSGKSYICSMLEKRGIRIYSCDDAAKRLMATSEKIHAGLTALVGDNAYVNGVLNKPALTSFLLKSPENTEKINSIVHPAVADDFVHSDYTWMECAILFSSGFDRLVDKTICVTAPLEVRIRRVMERDNISRQKACDWINHQMSQEDMAALSDYVIVNDGHSDIESQINKVLESLDR